MAFHQPIVQPCCTRHKIKCGFTSRKCDGVSWEKVLQSKLLGKVNYTLDSSVVSDVFTTPHLVVTAEVASDGELHSSVSSSGSGAGDSLLEYIEATCQSMSMPHRLCLRGVNACDEQGLFVGCVGDCCNVQWHMLRS
jgi:hypothetical protein